MDKYHAKMAIMARDGSTEANRMFWNAITNGEVDAEIVEFYNLSMASQIYVDSPEHKRLIELTNKYETRSVLNYEIW